MNQAMKTDAINRRTFLSRAAIAGGAALGAGLTTRAVAEVQPSIYAKAEAAGFPTPKYIQTNGIRMAVYEQGEGFPIVFSHGFPELGYSWRHQLPALAKAGFRAIAPDQRGYGRTDRPEKIEGYDIHHLTGDLAGLLDALKIEKAVFCGHDWGGAVVWQMAHLHPDRVTGVIAVNTPYMPRTPINPVDMLKQMRGDNNYIVYFQQPGVADTLLHDNVEKAFRAFLRKGLITAEQFNKLPANAPERAFDIRAMIEQGQTQGQLLVSEDELAYYVETFRDTGFTGPINWYRNIERNWKTTEGQSQKLEVPAMYVGAQDDVILPPAMQEATAALVPGLEQHVIGHCGHWTQQEKSEELNTLLIGWMTKRFKSA